MAARGDLVAELVQEVARNRLERLPVGPGHLPAPVADADPRGLVEPLLVLLARRLGLSDVAEHRVVVLEPGEAAHALELFLRSRDEGLVAHREVAADTNAPPEVLRGADLGGPLACEPRRVTGLAPAGGHDPLGDGEVRERRVPPVADQVHVERRREERLEQRQVLHVERRLVAPPRLAARRRVCLEHRRDRLPRRHPGPEPGRDGVGREAPLGERRQSAQIVRERLRVHDSPVPPGELRHEVRLVRDREHRVAVEHHAEERRPRPADAEDDQRRARLGHVGTVRTC